MSQKTNTPRPRLPWKHAVIGNLATVAFALLSPVALVYVAIVMLRRLAGEALAKLADPAAISVPADQVPGGLT